MKKFILLMYSLLNISNAHAETSMLSGEIYRDTLTKPKLFTNVNFWISDFSDPSNGTRLVASFPSKINNDFIKFIGSEDRSISLGLAIRSEISDLLKRSGPYLPMSAYIAKLKNGNTLILYRSSEYHIIRVFNKQKNQIAYGSLY